MRSDGAGGLVGLVRQDDATERYRGYGSIDLPPVTHWISTTLSSGNTIVLWGRKGVRGGGGGGGGGGGVHGEGRG